ncbi:MAG: RNA 2',3'-cyclic phosphodiesterase [Spirochaetia bacterium]|nr:RNA 2',3'-cyclic phosphodiesterase [Spirochaetia bacterium]
MNYFLGIALPESVKDQLSEIFQLAPDLDWEKKSNLHLTLCYFGKIDENQFEPLVKDLETISCLPFELEITHSGTFSHARHILWAGTKASPELEYLQKLCLNIALKHGFKQDYHEFNPHITLLKTKKDGIGYFSKILTQSSSYFPISFRLESFHLFSSANNGSGRVYKPFRTFYLANEPG